MSITAPSTLATKIVPPTPEPTRPLGAAMLSDLAWQQIAASLRLSGRELQIARATFDDRKELAIAADLGIAPRTVHTHIERLHTKLGVSDRSQLILRILHQFLSLTSAPQSTLPPICANRSAGHCPWREPSTNMVAQSRERFRQAAS